MFSPNLRRDAIRLASTTSNFQLRSALLEALKASTNTQCDFYRARDGKWYMDLESYEEDWDTGVQVHGEMMSYGPFRSFEAAERYGIRTSPTGGGGLATLYHLGFQSKLLTRR